MKVELLVNRGAIVDGRYHSQKPGDIIDVGKDEAERLIAKHRAVAVDKPTAKKKISTKKTSTKKSEDD